MTAIELAGHCNKLGQILINLVNNALKFTEQGSVSISIKQIGIELDKAVLRFEVSDSGMGISLENQQRLFNPFSQVDDSTTVDF